MTSGQPAPPVLLRIEQIAAAAQQVTATAGAMQQNMSEVATVAEGSSASTEEVSASTRETSASSEQIAASAHELASNAERLNHLVVRFHIADSDGADTSDVLGAAREAHEAWPARLREAIETGRCSIAVEDAAKDAACSLGKWLHGPGTLRDREPERWQTLHDLHEQVHRNAAQVMKAAVSGRHADALAMMQAPEYVEVERQLQAALRVPVAS
jgi:hypothetical protein